VGEAPTAGWAGRSVSLYGKGEAVAARVDSGGAAYFGKDVLGSVRTVTGTYGQIEERYEYDAFGKPYQGEFDQGLNLGYTGKPYDTATGLYDYGYRDYQPEAARFTTVDPVRDGANWFVYVNNDPVNYIDLWGLEIKDANTTLFMKSAGNIPLSDSEELISEVGCVLTTYTRIAIGISGRNISLQQANQKAMDMELFETGKDGQHNALSPENGAKLITALVDNPHINVTYDRSLSISNLTTAGSALLLLQGDDREFYTTGRILTTNAEGTKNYYHTVNINSGSVKSNPSIIGGYNIMVNDPSGVRNQIDNDTRSNTLQRIDVFEVHRDRNSCGK
jgi:RHS repeat-associated protein